ncbi:MAG: hypothetical protein LIO81_00920 [Clostridiales bacterium]|nr:hypothetical protein [Clostridiales bacterium]
MTDEKNEKDEKDEKITKPETPDTKDELSKEDLGAVSGGLPYYGQIVKRDPRKK